MLSLVTIGIVLWLFSTRTFSQEDSLFSEPSAANNFPENNNFVAAEDFSSLSGGNDDPQSQDIFATSGSDLDFTLSSDCNGGKDDFLLPNKIRVREKGTFCVDSKPDQNEKIFSPIMPEIMIQPDKPLVDQLNQLNDGKCIPPFPYNLCCNGFLIWLYSMGPPRVWTSVDDCYLNSRTFSGRWFDRPCFTLLKIRQVAFPDADDSIVTIDLPCVTHYDLCCQSFTTVSVSVKTWTLSRYLIQNI